MMVEILEDALWNSEMHYAFILYKRIFQLMGIWPYSCQTISAWCLTLFTWTTQITMIFMQVAESIYNAQVDPGTMSYLSCNFLSLIKVAIIRANSPNIQQVLNLLMAAWSSDINPEALKTMKVNARFGRKVCIYQLGSTYFVLVPVIIMALPVFVPTANYTVNGTVPLVRSLPVPSHIFTNVPYWLYVIIYIYQVIQLVYTCTGNVGIDCCFFGMAVNLTAQLHCLASEFEEIGKIKEEKLRKIIFASKVRRQTELIKLAEYLESAFNFIILCIVTANCSQICFYGIAVIRSAKSSNFVVFINVLLCIVILTIQIFLYSYAGDGLSRAFENIRFAVYRSLWYMESVAERKNVLFVMMRTHKIFNLTASKIYRMDLDSFKTIIKGIGSYFSVMQAFFSE